MSPPCVADPSVVVRDRLGAWPLRVLWVLVPFAAGPLLARALDDTATPFRTVVSVALWVLWAILLVAMLIPRPVTLTAIRVAVPVLAPLSWWATATTSVDATAAAALTIAVLAVVAVLDPVVGELFVDGSSYGAERRMPLAPTASVLLGPVPVGWVVTVAGLTVGPLLLADQQWWWGAAATAVGAPLAAAAARRLHVLARRWVILVPGGVVVHDPLALREPVLMPRSSITTVAPALEAATGDRLDLTGRARGLALEFTVAPPVSFAVARGGTATDVLETGSVVLTPSRPGHVADALRDHLRLG